MGYLRIIGVWPFPIESVQQACAKAEKVFVPELSLGQLYREVERHVECPVHHYGRIGGILPTVTELEKELQAVITNEVGS